MIRKSAAWARPRVLVLLAALAACVRCSPGDGKGFRGGTAGVAPGPCPVVSVECPDAGGPSYENDVLPIFKARCVGCHSAGGQNASTPLTTYLEVTGRAGRRGIATTVQTRIAGCEMPPAPLPRLTPEERATVSEWYACGAPQN